MTFVHVCEKGHTSKYQLYSKIVFDNTEGRSKAYWKCPIEGCGEKLLARTHIDDNPNTR